MRFSYSIGLDLLTLLRFDRGRHTGDVSRPASSAFEEKLKGIRCPLCKWRPDRESRWLCSDCGDPEYFDGGCGTCWNTFDTGGICPACSHQWIWTSCLACHGWSRHEDWYETE